MNWWIVYLNGIVIYSKGPGSHLMRPEAMLQKLENITLKLKPLECKLFYIQITYLGHIISAQGIATDKRKMLLRTSLSLPPSLRLGVSLVSMANIAGL